MRYLGGKSRIAKQIVTYLESVRNPNQEYWEPFLGGCNILPLMSGKRTGSDVHLDIILFYQALQQGWMPPENVTKEEYDLLKNAEPSALRGFVGIACSFSGKWFGGYARSGTRNYAKNGKNTAVKTAEKIKNATLICQNYQSLVIPDGALVYCDPPYAGTTGYSFKFNHTEFWTWAKHLSKTCDVYVSEYTAPNFCKEVLTINRNLEMRRNKEKSEPRLEKLFKVGNTP